MARIRCGDQAELHKILTGSGCTAGLPLQQPPRLRCTCKAMPCRHLPNRACRSAQAAGAKVRALLPLLPVGVAGDGVVGWLSSLAGGRHWFSSRRLREVSLRSSSASRCSGGSDIISCYGVP